MRLPAQTKPLMLESFLSVEFPAIPFQCPQKNHVTRAACSDGDYSKRTLKLANELPLASLFRDSKGQGKFEASSVVTVNDTAYAVCDSSWAISKFDTKLEPFSEINLQIGDPDREAADSGYEAIFHIEGDKFYVVRESVHHGTRKRDKHHKKRPLAGYHAIIEELVIQGDDYRVVEQCSTELEFEGTSKGFEGAIPIYDLNHELVVLGLCEANHCSEKLKKDRGHGELVAMRKSIDVNGECLWKSIRRIHFHAAPTFKTTPTLVCKTSLEESLSSRKKTRNYGSVTFLDAATPACGMSSRWSSTPTKAPCTTFPRTTIATIYCNVEGVHWLSKNMIIAVSDKMKGRGKQDNRCFDKDQSVHVFLLP
jgi:hypothetical protein